MDIRKLDKGQMFLKFREIDIIAFIKDVMMTFDYLAKKKNINFIFEHESDSLNVYVDPNNFDKVLMNLLSNAFKFTPENGSVTIKLSLGQDKSRKDALKSYFEITIADTGIGLDNKNINRIFERFYQVDNDLTKSNFGTGIGLHLSQSLVKLHHGSINAENRQDISGSIFTIRIPLETAHLRSDEFETGIKENIDLKQITASAKEDLNYEYVEEKPGKKSKIKAKTSIRVLIVEDELEIRSYLKDELSDEYRITTCENGKEAYSIILKDTPDLIISDVMMPEMDGLTLCRKIKQNTNINHLPVILLTAKSKHEDTLEGMSIGADAYIVKPFNTSILKSTISNLIENRKLLRHTYGGSQNQEDKIQKITLKSSDEILMSKFMKVVNENISQQDLNAEMLAAHVGMSRVHVHRKLKELTNLSARDFIKNIRMQQDISD